LQLESVVKYAKKHDRNTEGCWSTCRNGCVIGERRKANLNLMLDNRMTEQLTAETVGESNETLLIFIISTRDSCRPVLGRDSVDCQG
jgi:hypothetical protein